MKIFLQKIINQIENRSDWDQKLYYVHSLLKLLMVKTLLEIFTNNNCKMQINLNLQ